MGLTFNLAGAVALVEPLTTPFLAELPDATGRKLPNLWV
jgi:hypothetical protein